MTLCRNTRENKTFTRIEENFCAVKMFSCTGDMQWRSIVAIMRLHQSSTVNHELNTLRITCFDTSKRLLTDFTPLVSMPVTCPPYKYIPSLLSFIYGVEVLSTSQSQFYSHTKMTVKSNYYSATRTCLHLVDDVVLPKRKGRKYPGSAFLKMYFHRRQ